MWGSMRIGRLFGIEIRLDFSWFLVFFLLAWSLSAHLFPGMDFGPGMSWVMGIVAALLLFASVLAHELAHALMAQSFGAEVHAITLFLFGGVAQLKGDPRTPREEFLITIVGPVTSFALGAVCLAVAWIGGWLTGAGPVVAVLAYLGTINLILAAFNLVPGFPLDGGRILRSAIWQHTGNLRKATRWAANMGHVFAWGLMAYGLVFRVMLERDLGGLWMVFIGWFLNTAAEAEYQQLILRRALCGVPVAEVMEQHVPVVSSDLAVSRFVDDYLLRYDHAAYPVERGGELVGVVTLDEVRGLDRAAWTTTPLARIMELPEGETSVRADEDAWDVLTRMLETDTPRLLVVADGQAIGAISREAILHLMRRKMRLGLAEIEDGASPRVRITQERRLGT